MIKRHRVPWFDVLVVLVTGILYTVAWPTLHVTHQVPAAVQPIVAALAAGPLLLLRANPALGWAISAFGALVVSVAFASQPNNDLPWQVVHILVILPLLFAVALRAALPIVGVAWLSTVLLFAANMGADAKVGWTVALTAYVVIALLLRWLVLSRRQLAEEAERSELERARRAILEEKARIARDLHDVVAHHMSLVVVQAQSAPYRIADVSPAARAEFESIGASAREALNEIRGMLGVLRSDGQIAEQVPQPRATQLRELLDSTRRAGVTVAATISGDAESVSATTGLAAYRILQESLSNAARHAQGAEVEVVAEFGVAAVTLVVRNGRGTASTHSGTGGAGITGMRDRAIAVGGTVSAAPTADGGFEVLAYLPVSAPVTLSA